MSPPAGRRSCAFPIATAVTVLHWDRTWSWVDRDVHYWFVSLLLASVAIFFSNILVLPPPPSSFVAFCAAIQSSSWLMCDDNFWSSFLDPSGCPTLPLTVFSLPSLFPPLPTAYASLLFLPKPFSNLCSSLLERPSKSPENTAFPDLSDAGKQWPSPSGFLSVLFLCFFF